jgi:hypothetical protein
VALAGADDRASEAASMIEAVNFIAISMGNDLK